MEEKAARLMKAENEISINKNSQAAFFFEYQKSILLTISEQGVIDGLQCQQCIEKLLKQFKI